MRNLLLLSLCFVLLAIPCSAQNAPLPFTLHEVGPGEFAAIDLQGHAGSNAGFVIGDDGVAVIDTFEDEDAARALLAEIRKKTSLPIKFVVDTHYHLDHVAGNGVFAQAGAVVMAQRNVRAWIHTENLKFFGAKITPEQRAMVEGYFAPELVYDAGVTLYLGKRKLIVKTFQGHTGGDSAVIIPGEQGGHDVVFCGDLFWNHLLPNLIDANTKALLENLSDLSRVGANDRGADSQLSAGTVFIPGHGEVGNLQDLEAFRGYLVDLREMVAGPVREGKTGDALLTAVMPELQAKYGSWGIFQHFAKPNILLTAEELRGTKRVPHPLPTPPVAIP
ncbi:MAG TPA: MBL fold metallo-hydrolase [Candidatus Acidoferrum sp.]|nr:MBL fold metallo-hydrolase [Candidatus Acidoferrum sp.]